MNNYTPEGIARAAKAALDAGDAARAKRLIEFGKTLTSTPARVSVDQTPDGRSVAPDTTAEEAANIPSGMVFDDRTGGYVDTAADAERMGKGWGAAASYLAGTPAIGEWTDEAMGKIDGYLADRNPEIAQETMRQSRSQFAESNPNLALGAEITGGIVGSIPALPGAAKFISGGKSLLTKGLRGLALGSTTGAVEGASQGYGSGTTDSTRADNALSRAALTGGLSGALGLAAPAIGAGLGAVGRKVLGSGQDVKEIRNQLGLSAPAARIVKQHLINDDLNDVARNFAEKGDEALLAEAGPSTMQLLDTVMSTGGGALKTGRDAVKRRLDSAADNWNRTLTETLGDASGGIKEAGKRARQATAPQRQAAYDAAYAQPTPMAGPGGSALQNVLKRIEADTVREAVKEGQAEALDKGYENLNLMASIGPDGKITYTQPLSVLELDFLARGLQIVVEAGTDKMTGKMSAAAKRANGQVKALRKVLKTHVPGYAKALKLGQDNALQDEALKMGRNLLSSKTQLEDVVDMMRKVGPSKNALVPYGQPLPADIRSSIATGVRENIEAIAGRAKATIAALENGSIDFDAGTNAIGEAVEALRSIATPSNIKKLRVALGKEKADKLFAAIKKQGDAMVLAAATARTTATAIRTAGREAIQSEVGPGVLRSVAGELGSPMEAARPITRSIAGTDAKSLARAEEEYFTEIANALTQMKGPDAKRALNLVKAKMAGQPVADAKIDKALAQAGVALTTSVHQSGKQKIAP
jgi:hypothetical protein